MLFGSVGRQKSSALGCHDLLEKNVTSNVRSDANKKLNRPILNEWTLDSVT
jgi:hypothetical protein